jgi:hypothetical protein
LLYVLITPPKSVHPLLRIVFQLTLQLTEFNPTWVNALEQRLTRPARDVGVHYESVECGHPTLRLVQQNWETEGLIVPMTFGEHVAADSDEDSVYGFPDVYFGSDDEEYTFPPPPSPATPSLLRFFHPLL